MSNWYTDSFKNQIIRHENKIPKDRLKNCRIYIEVFEDDIHLINQLIEDAEGDNTFLICALSAYGMIDKVIGKTGQFLRLEEIKNLRNNFGYKIIYLEINKIVKGNSTKFLDKLRPSNWFLKKC